MNKDHSNLTAFLTSMSRVVGLRVNTIGCGVLYQLLCKINNPQTVQRKETVLLSDD